MKRRLNKGLLVAIPAMLLTVACGYGPMGPHIGMGYGGMGGYYGWGGLLMWLLLVLVVGAVVYIVVQQQKRTTHTHAGETSLDILKKRYARGEIDRETFESMKRDIEG